MYLLLGVFVMAGAYGGSKLFTLPGLLRDWRAFQEWRAAAAAARREGVQPPNQPQGIPDPVLSLDTTPLPGACFALAKPPTNLQHTLSWLRRKDPSQQYAFPIGWYRNKDDQAALCYGAFVGDVNHILISGMSDAGKDNVALNILFTLALSHSPAQLQIAVIDGKGLDFSGWKDRAHTWRLASQSKEIGPAMEALSAERERRRAILEVAGVSKWENYAGGDLPLLVTYISELSLLEDATNPRDLTQWLNSELAAGRAFGMRYIIATQTVSNFSTRWRSQISQYLAGFQPSESQDQPNTGLTTRELESLKSVPPSKLPAPPTGAGVFTAIHGRDCVTVRASYLSDEQRRAWLQRLPAVTRAVEAAVAMEAPPQGVSTALERHKSVLPTASAHIMDGLQRCLTPASTALVAAPVEAGNVDIPVEEKQQILQLAAAGHSRRKVCEQVYGAPGGRAYERVKAVLDQQPA